jgi:hypothetical protein
VAGSGLRRTAAHQGKIRRRQHAQLVQGLWRSRAEKALERHPRLRLGHPIEPQLERLSTTVPPTHIAEIAHIAFGVFAVVKGQRLVLIKIVGASTAGQGNLACSVGIPDGIGDAALARARGFPVRIVGGRLTNYTCTFNALVSAIKMEPADSCGRKFATGKVE